MDEGFGMNQLEMIKIHLVATKYDGLCRPQSDCGCAIDDLWPCGDPCPSCQAAYRSSCENCGSPMFVTNKKSKLCLNCEEE